MVDIPHSADIDQAILGCLEHGRERKTVMVIHLAMERLACSDTEAITHRIAERIRHLVAQGSLESAGDLHQWRFSEVRLADSSKRGDPA